MKGKIIFTLLFLLAVVSVNAQDAKSLYDYKMTDIDGNTFDMSELKGKKVLLVNTATECGYHPQLTDMEKLYEDYKDELVIVAIPSNDFGNKEPGTNEEIKKVVKEDYGATYPIMQKTSVTGENEAPIYEWLTKKDLNGTMDTEVSWNFQKYMIDENGQIVGIVDPEESPNSDKVMQWLEEE